MYALSQALVKKEKENKKTMNILHRHSFIVINQWNNALDKWYKLNSISLTMCS